MSFFLIRSNRTTQAFDRPSLIAPAYLKASVSEDFAVNIHNAAIIASFHNICVTNLSELDQPGDERRQLGSTCSAMSSSIHLRGSPVTVGRDSGGVTLTLPHPIPLQQVERGLSPRERRLLRPEKSGLAMTGGRRRGISCFC